MRRARLFALALLFAAPIPLAHGADCLRANQEGQALEGVLQSVRIYDEAYHRTETAFILTLKKPACLTGEDAYDRVGGTTRVHVDVRIISSSSRDLQEEIAAGRFREDLFHRLSVVPIRVPALSERREDVPELIQFFMDNISSQTGLPKRRIAEDAMAVLQSHNWPGNVRQLKNNVERLMILTQADPEQEVTSEMLPSEIGALVPTTPGGAGGEKLMSLALREAREIFEREYLVAQIARFSGNISRTAEFIGMERSALHRKLKSLGIGP